MNILFDVVTDKSFEQAVADLKASLGAVSFGVLWELNFRDKLHEKGLDFADNIQILEVCNPKQAKKALETQIEVGAFLPCKLVVFEKAGEVHLALPRPSALIGLIENSSLVDVASEVEAALKSAIDSSK
ncbi:MAG: DUF302 domain-containing protein [Clostridia bacterium]|nr:DUF302 domain-containing protein [Clostridia bacterium]NCC75498.1 DUF302 domain-containing protein [Clostridia bacterium]